METGAIARIFFKEELFGVLVALVITTLLYFYLHFIRKQKQNYLLFTFIPTVVASVFPDTMFVLVEMLQHGVKQGVKVAVYGATSGTVHAFFHSILTSWVVIPMLLGLVWLVTFIAQMTGRFNIHKPDYWILYVTVIAMLSLVNHIYVMDPLGF